MDSDPVRAPGEEESSRQRPAGRERDKAGVPYALLANERGYQGAAFVGLSAGVRRQFWSFVEGRAAAQAPIVGLKKTATWLKPGMTAKVRYLKGSDKMRHAVVQDLGFER